MELSWPSRIKLTAVIVLGVVVFGILAWPYVKPADPMGPFTFANISAIEFAVLALASFVIGFVAYFLSWPWGRQMAVIAVPSGLAALAFRSGELLDYIRSAPDPATRSKVYSALMPETAAWLVLAALGYVGVLAASRLAPAKSVPLDTGAKKQTPANIALGVIFSAILAYICTSLLARDVSFTDKTIGSVIGQPSVVQGCCAALFGFTIAAFLVKRFFDANYIWPALSSILVALFALHQAAKPATLKYLASAWPPAFFANGIFALLPVQIISLGIIGSVLGYWLAVRWKFWWENHA